MSDSSKPCNTCGRVLSITEFSRDRSLKSGRRGRCKACCSVDSKSWDRNNAERRRQTQARYREENYDRLKEKVRKWRAENPDRMRERRKRYYADHKAEELSYAVYWRTENYEKYLAHKRNSSSRRRGAPGKYGVADIEAMYKDQGEVCAYCEAPLRGVFHIDHMTPICRGGTNDWTNLALTCPACNLRKNRQTVEEFFAT